MSPQAASTPDILPGPAAATLVIDGFWYELGAFLIGCFAIVEGYLPGKWYYWGAVILFFVVTMLTIGARKTLRGYRKLSAEKQRGYSTAVGPALRDLSLFYVHRKTFKVLATPYQPRPGRRRRK